MRAGLFHATLALVAALALTAPPPLSAQEPDLPTRSAAEALRSGYSDRLKGKRKRAALTGGEGLPRGKAGMGQAGVSAG